MARDYMGPVPGWAEKSAYFSFVVMMWMYCS